MVSTMLFSHDNDNVVITLLSHHCCNNLLMENWTLKSSLSYSFRARAPDSTVIIVGTFHDNLTGAQKRTGGFVEDMHNLIYQKYIGKEFGGGVGCPRERGLPKVVHVIDVSCVSSGYNIQKLRDLIYTTAMDVKMSGTLYCKYDFVFKVFMKFYFILFYLVWFGLVWFGLIWFDLIWFDLIWFDLIWVELSWVDLSWFGLVWFDLIWVDLSWGDFSDENALKVAVKRFCCASNLIRHVSRYSLTSFCN